MDIYGHLTPTLYIKGLHSADIYLTMKDKMISLKKFAEQNGVSYKTAHRHWQRGLIDGIQLPTGTILVNGWKHEAPAEVSSTKEVTGNDAVILIRTKKTAEVNNNISALKELASTKGINIIDIIIWDGYIFQSNPFVVELIDKNISYILTNNVSNIYGVNAECMVELLQRLGVETISLEKDKKNVPQMIYNSVIAGSNMAKAAVGMASYKRAIAESNQQLLD